MKLKNTILTELYRPETVDELVFNNRDKIKKYISSKDIPSFIFYSSSAGTGKTSLAKIIIKELDCDYITLNSSDERGIDTVRQKINLFAKSLSSNQKKRCIFLDEADGLTSQAQDSLRNLMETYSKNCFFILSCNDINKIISPIQSRCVLVNFEKPPREEIIERIMYICDKEEISLDMDIDKFVNNFYPDIRSMVKNLEEIKLSGSVDIGTKMEFDEVLKKINEKDVKYLYEKTYSGDIDMMGFVKWLFRYLFENYNRIGFEKCRDVSFYLAEIEKSYKMNINLEIVFLSNMVQIMDRL